VSGTSAVVTIKRRYVYEDVDRRGRVRIYFWRGKGHRKNRIHEQIGTEAFDARYHELARQAAAGELKPPPREAPKIGTFRWLCHLYLTSQEFKGLDPRTQRVRRQNIDHICAEHIAPGASETFGSCPLSEFGPKAVKIIRDRKRHAPESANQRVKIVRAVFRWALDPANEVVGVQNNPARDVPFLRPKRHGGFHSWTREEIGQYERVHPIGTKARLALALLVYTGVRRSDVVLLGRQHVRDGWLKFTAQKNRNRKPTIVEIPVLEALRSVIDASPAGDLTYLVTEFGKPYTFNGFGNWFKRQCRLAGLDHCSAHGLRKAAAATAAENGATELELMAIFGWLTMKEAERYTKAAERRRLAANAPRLLERPNSEQIFPTSDAHSDVVGKKRAKS
jgi:integrase